MAGASTEQFYTRKFGRHWIGQVDSKSCETQVACNVLIGIKDELKAAQKTIMYTTYLEADQLICTHLSMHYF